MTHSEGETTPILKTSKGFVYIFLRASVLNGASNYLIPKVVVFDKFSIEKKTALVIFHTTNLNSKSINWDWKTKKTKYHRYKCFLELESNGWMIKEMDVSDCPLKSLH